VVDFGHMVYDALQERGRRAKDERQNPVRGHSALGSVRFRRLWPSMLSHTAREVELACTMEERGPSHSWWPVDVYGSLIFLPEHP